MQYVAGAGEEEVWACGREPDVFSLQWLSGGGAYNGLARLGLALSVLYPSVKGTGRKRLKPRI